MANKIFNTRVKNKRDTEANWTSKNPVLLNGEIAIVDTTSGETRFKVGDGTKRYSQLPFQDAATLAHYVQTTRKINNKALSSDISLTASDVGALPSTTTSLKNPNALTFTGAVTGSYDGSASKSVAIPSVDSALSSTSTNAIQNKVIAAALDGKAGTAVATASAPGLMSAADKRKLDGVETGANKTVVDATLDGTSENPVQNKAVKAALDGKAGTAAATQSAAGLLSAADKKKLDGIAAGATKVTVDAAMSDTSENPVQNKAILSVINKKAAASDLALKADKASPKFTGSILLQEESGEDFSVTATVRPFDDDNISLNFEPESPNSSYTGVVIDNLATVDAYANGWSNVAVNQEMMEEYVSRKIRNTSVTASSSDGVAYTATVPGINSLTTGASFIMVPKKTSASKEPTLNVNSLGEKKIRRRLNSMTTVTSTGYANTWISANKPFSLIYDGTYWIVEGMEQPVGADMYGAVPQATADASGNVITDTYATIAMVNSLVDLFYPIGSIYMSTNQTDDPQSRFTGTYWLPIYDRFLLGAGNTYKTAKAKGGEATHTLTANEMPNHQHSIWFPNSSGEQNAAIGFPTAGSKNTYYAEASKTGGAGGGAAHNNMPPYYTVYMWRRVTFQEYEAGADGG